LTSARTIPSGTATAVAGSIWVTLAWTCGGGAPATGTTMGALTSASTGSVAAPAASASAATVAVLTGRATARTSTVERELALATAWLRVQRHIGRPLDVELAASPLAARSGIGAMLVLPLLQEMQATPSASRLAWRLSAEIAPSGRPAGDDAGAARTPRLWLRLAPRVQLPDAGGIAATTPGIERIRARIAELHGSTAMIAVAALGNDAIAYQVELPFIEEIAGDADGVDR